MSSAFGEYVCDLLSPWANVTMRSMFGGIGFYRDGTIFAISIEDTLYLKVTGFNRTMFEDAGSEPFSYEAKGKRVAMSYWEVPQNVMDDEDALALWAAEAYRAALAVKKKPAAKKKRS